MCRDSIQRVNQLRFQTGVLCTRVNCITVSHYMHKVTSPVVSVGMLVWLQANMEDCTLTLPVRPHQH